MPPGICNRCDALVHIMQKEIAKLDPTMNQLLIVETDYEDATTGYLKENEIWDSELPNSSLIVAKRNEFSKYLKFSTKIMQVPYVLLANLKCDSIINTQAVLGAKITSDFILKQLNILKEFKCGHQSTKIRINNNIKVVYTPPNDKIIWDSTLYYLKHTTGRRYLSDTSKHNNDYIQYDSKKNTCFLQQDSIFPPPSNLNYFSCNDSIITATDQISRKIYLLKPKIKDSKITISKVFSPTNAEYLWFTNNQKSFKTANYLHKNNLIKALYFNSEIINDNLYYSASLPMVSVINDTLIHYYNSGCTIAKNINTEMLNYLNTAAHYWSKQLIDTAVFSVSHINFRIDPFTDDIYYRTTKKSWFGNGTTFNDSISCDIDPSCGSYYNNMPIYAKITGKNNNYLGEIDSSAFIYKCGYSFCKPDLEFSKEKYFYTDGFSGKISIQNKIDNNTNYVQLFNIPVDSSIINIEQKATQDYLTELNSVFSKFITDIRYHDGVLYASVGNSKQASLYEIDLTNYTSRVIAEITSPISAIEASFIMIQDNQPRLYIYERGHVFTIITPKK